MSAEYQKGYAAGRKRLAVDRARDAFWRQAFLSALPAFLSSDSRWTRGGKPITTIPGLTQLAADLATEALKHWTRV